MNKNEIRISAQCASIREAKPDAEGNIKQSRTIEGYAIVFNEESVLLDDWGIQFREVIEPSCCTQEYVDAADIKMTLFHNREKLLARSNKGKGSLRLFVDDLGVRFEFDAPETADGDMALEGVKRGDLNGCSFTFTPKDYKTEEREDGSLLIRHTQFAWLGEMTIGSDAAYQQTSVNCREVTENLPSAVKQREEKAKQNAKCIRESFLRIKR